MSETPQVKINFKGAEGERTRRPEAKWKSRWHQRAVLIASRLPAFPLLVYHCLDLTSVHEKVNVLQISCRSQGGPNVTKKLILRNMLMLLSNSPDEEDLEHLSWHSEMETWNSASPRGLHLSAWDQT